MSSEIEKIEISIEEAKRHIQLRDDALRLADNKDFRNIVLEGYFKNEAARLTGLIGDPEFKEQEAILADLGAIASFQRYMRRLVRTGEMMEKEVFDHEQALEDIRTNPVDYELN